jgi:hypothetical protein
MSLPRPWLHASAISFCVAGTCNPHTVCTCLETSAIAPNPQSYLLDSQGNERVGILAPDLGKGLTSFGHITTQPDTYYPFHFSSYPAGTATSATKGDELSGDLSTMYGGTPSHAALAASYSRMTPLQRFEAELVSSQPYNTVSSIRFNSSGNSILPQSQRSHDIAYNGSNISGPASRSFEI